MKVQKIDIKKEILDIPDNQDRVYFDEKELPSVMKEGEAPGNSQMVVERKTYLLQRVKHSFREKPINYLVNVNEQELFSDLVTVSNDLFTRAIQEQKLAIKQLSWWNRLFNKF